MSIKALEGVGGTLGLNGLLLTGSGVENLVVLVGLELGIEVIAGEGNVLDGLRGVLFGVVVVVVLVALITALGATGKAASALLLVVGVLLIVGSGVITARATASISDGVTITTTATATTVLLLSVALGAIEAVAVGAAGDLLIGEAVLAARTVTTATARDASLASSISEARTASDALGHNVAARGGSLVAIGTFAGVVATGRVAVTTALVAVAGVGDGIDAATVAVVDVTKTAAFVVSSHSFDFIFNFFLLFQ